LSEPYFDLTSQRNFKRQISEPVELALNKPTSDMWDTVLRSFRLILGKSEVTYLTKARSESIYSSSLLLFSSVLISSQGFNCTDEENATSLATLRRRAWILLRSKIDDQTADAAILGKLRTYFEERFRYDEQGIPRVWRPEDDIDGAFKKAKDQVCGYVIVK
jgi:hypothetical protein